MSTVIAPDRVEATDSHLAWQNESLMDKRMVRQKLLSISNRIAPLSLPLSSDLSSGPFDRHKDTCNLAQLPQSTVIDRGEKVFAFASIHTLTLSYFLAIWPSTDQWPVVAFTLSLSLFSRWIDRSNHSRHRTMDDPWPRFTVTTWRVLHFFLFSILILLLFFFFLCSWHTWFTDQLRCKKSRTELQQSINSLLHLMRMVPFCP